MKYARGTIGLLLMTGMTLMTVKGTHQAPDLAEAAAQIGVAVDDLDANFGVVPIDPTNGLYSVQVRSDRVPLPTDTTQPYRGPFSNPRIETFGPPKK